MEEEERGGGGGRVLYIFEGRGMDWSGRALLCVLVGTCEMSKGMWHMFRCKTSQF